MSLSQDATIPNFALSGNPNQPEILSNKVILTPPAPGNQRAAIWADKPLQHTRWVVDVDFRASGPEHAGGNLNIWLVKDPAAVGTSSVYQVGTFEGLALVLHTFGGSSQSMVRGFLNDGYKDYAKMTVDGQSFGHCTHAYRNLGRPSQLKLRQTADNFKVEIDGQLCFESAKISIPAGYRLGVTAASADNPDSFEIFKLVVMSENVDPGQDAGQPQKVLPQGGDQQQQQQQDGGMFANTEAQTPPVAQKFESAFEDDMPDTDALVYTSSSAQFADLHQRLQSYNHHLSAIFKRMGHQESVGETRHAEVATQLNDLKGLLSKLDKLDAMEAKMSSLENEVRKIRGDVTNKVNSAERAIKGAVTGTHDALHAAVKENASPGHGRLIAVVIGSQLVLVAGYVVYKKKKSSPKKYM